MRWLLVPEELDQALIGSGIPGFQALSIVRRGEVRFLKAIKNSRVSRYLTDRALGMVSRDAGLAFEEFASGFLVGAKRNVPTIGKNSIDFDWRGRLIELKTSTSIIGDEGALKQLEAAAQAAKQSGKTLVYMFLERPTQKTTEKVEEAGGIVIYWFDR